jgi:glycosyltransferase involved in cell wall biosynthesis
MNPSDYLVFNDHVQRGRFGERTLWTYLVEDLGLPFHDWTTLRANSWYEAKLNILARHKDQPKVGIQNATWAHPNTCNARRTIAILQDNIIRMWNDPVPQRATLDAADVVVCNGTLIAADYHLICGAKTRVIPIGIDVEFWTPKERAPHRGRPRVVFVGDVAPHKGYEIIAALARKRRDLDWTFVLKHDVGHDRELGWTFVACAPETVRGVLQDAEVFILGSPVETQCLAALEAMACDVPVVMRPTGVFYDWRPLSFFAVQEPTVDGFEAQLAMALSRFKRSQPVTSPRADLLARRDLTLPGMLASWRALLEEVATGA